MFSSKVIPEIVARHAENASFLWSLRDRATDQPHYSLPDLLRLDDRVEAHLDGLCIAAEDDWGVCEPLLTLDRPEDLFTTGVVGFRQGRKALISSVIDAAAAVPEYSGPVTSALAWLSSDLARPHIAGLTVSEIPRLRCIGIAAAIIQGQDCRQALADALTDSDEMLRAYAIRAAGELAFTKLLPELQQTMVTGDQVCRFWAAWSVALLTGDPHSIEVLRLAVDSNRYGAGQALEVAIRRLDAVEARRWHQRLASAAPLRILSIRAARAIGDPLLVPFIVDQMSSPATARVAGEAFTTVTGLDIPGAGFEVEKPEDFQTGPTEDPNDENVEMDPEEHLPWPDQNKIQAWWHSHQSDFVPGTRYLLGVPMTIDWLESVLRKGRQHQRANAALELSIRQPGRALFDIKAPGLRQQQLL